MPLHLNLAVGAGPKAITEQEILGVDDAILVLFAVTIIVRHVATIDIAREDRGIAGGTVFGIPYPVVIIVKITGITLAIEVAIVL